MNMERLRSLAANVAIWAYCVGGPAPFLSRGRLVCNSYSLHDEDAWIERIHPDDFERVIAAYTSATHACVPFRIRYRMCGSDGIYRWLTDTALPVFAPTGVFEGYVGVSLPARPSPRSGRGRRRRRFRGHWLER
jgi:hypothetical protein